MIKFTDIESSIWNHLYLIFEIIWVKFFAQYFLSFSKLKKLKNQYLFQITELNEWVAYHTLQEIWSRNILKFSRIRKIMNHFLWSQAKSLYRGLFDKADTRWLYKIWASRNVLARGRYMRNWTYVLVRTI